MSHQQKTRPISKQRNNPKKPYRPQFNNNNPNNKLTLNDYHQIVSEHPNDNKKSDGFKLHKRKRDLERLIKHCQQKGIQIDSAKQQQLDDINQQLGGRRKKYQKDKRKEFFLQQKYKDIKRIELRKVYKHLGQTKANSSMTQHQKNAQINLWEQKLRYIKYFPKTLKYISLFPSSKPLEEKTLEFQKKIMADIEAENAKKVARLNYYKSQNQSKNIRGARCEEDANQNSESKRGKKESILPLTMREVSTKDGKKKKRQMVDDFFVQQEEDSENQNQQMEDENGNSEQSDIDEEVEAEDEDDDDVSEEESQ